jgi:flagellar basal body-associated protein FliL
MNQGMSNAPTLPPEKPKGSNTTLIIVIVVLVLCCLCALVVGVLYQFGDAILKALGLG